MSAASRTGNLDLTSRVVASKDQVSSEVDNETVILSLTTGEYYGLNVVASHIWSLIQQERSLREVRDVLMEAYDGIDEDGCTTQVIAVINDMLEMGLIERVGAS